MEIYKDQYFEGERPLYARRDGLYLERVKIGPGESSIKEGANIEAVNCEFNGKYPFWECDGFVIRDCLFREGARAALWYTRHCKMYNTLVEAPKCSAVSRTRIWRMCSSPTPWKPSGTATA